MISTRPLNLPGTRDAERDPTPESDLSHSSEEDNAEEPSRQCLANLVTAVLETQDLGALDDKYWLSCNLNALRSTVFLGSNGALKANTDGGVVVAGAGTHTDSTRYGIYPIVSFEAKRRHAGGLKHDSGEMEPFSPRVLAQEVGELLGQAMTNCKQVEENGWIDQESWCLTMHGTEMRLVTTRFSRKYLSNVSSPFMRTTERAVVFRSRPFNLKLDNERTLALKAIVSLLRYLKSGEAEIGLLKLALSRMPT